MDSRLVQHHERNWFGVECNYRYRYDACFLTTSIFDNSGAYHTSKIPEVFGTYPTSNQFGTVTTADRSKHVHAEDVGGPCKESGGWRRMG